MIDHLLVGLTRFLVGGRPEWRGSQPSTRQRIYFANHGSHLDTILIWAALPKPLRATTHPVAAADYWGRGRLRQAIALGLLNSVLVDRSGKTAKEDLLDPLKAELARGHSLVIFPEGTRARARCPGPSSPASTGWPRAPAGRAGAGLSRQSLPRLPARRLSAGTDLLPRPLRRRPAPRGRRGEGDLPDPRARRRRRARLRFAVDPQLLILFAGLVAVLAVASVTGHILRRRVRSPSGRRPSRT